MIIIDLRVFSCRSGGSVSAMRSSATSGIGLMPTMSPNWYLGGSPTSVTSHSRDDVPHLDQQRPVTSSTAQQSGINVSTIVENLILIFNVGKNKLIIKFKLVIE